MVTKAVIHAAISASDVWWVHLPILSLCKYASTEEQKHWGETPSYRDQVTKQPKCEQRKPEVLDHFTLRFTAFPAATIHYKCTDFSQHCSGYHLSTLKLSHDFILFDFDLCLESHHITRRPRMVIELQNTQTAWLSCEQHPTLINLRPNSISHLILAWEPGLRALSGLFLGISIVGAAC